MGRVHDGSGRVSGTCGHRFVFHAIFCYTIDTLYSTEKLQMPHGHPCCAVHGVPTVHLRGVLEPIDPSPNVVATSVVYECSSWSSARSHDKAYASPVYIGPGIKIMDFHTFIKVFLIC